MTINDISYEVKYGLLRASNYDLDPIINFFGWVVCAFVFTVTLFHIIELINNLVEKLKRILNK
jgi:hypothetical protein